MTFEQFQATKTHCADIGEAISADMGVDYPVSGNLYLGRLYIEETSKLAPIDITDRGKWSLLIGREEWVSFDLEDLERKLFAFAVSAGYADNPAPHLDRITKDDIVAAANTADIDDACRSLQNIARITDGGVASVMFSGFDWDASQPDERFAQIVKWLETERRYAQRGKN